MDSSEWRQIKTGAMTVAQTLRGRRPVGSLCARSARLARNLRRFTGQISLPNSLEAIVAEVFDHTAYVHHKASGQARLRINDKDHYLGVFGSAESHLLYEEVIDGIEGRPQAREGNRRCHC